MEIKDCVNLDTAMEWLSELAGFKDWLNETEDTAVISYHHTLGRSVRNDLNLWVQESIMSIYFQGYGIYHADDMSSIILTSLHRKYNHKPIDLQKQIDRHIEYWENTDPSVNKGIFN